jgi:hypothetical protein
MSNLTIKSGSALGNKGNITLKFSSIDEKKAYVKANLKQVKQPVLDGTEPLKAVVEQQEFESELEAWAEEQGYVLAEDKPVHYEPLRFLSFSATKPAKVRRLAEFMTKEEWNCKILSSVTMKRLGLKGSPKLSKVLVSLGVPSRKVELMLSGSVKSVVASNVSYVTNDEAYIEDQGNSVYYSSCQATDSRAKWSGGDSYCRVEEDLEAWGLFLWCIGDPMHVDGKGFIARAKVRLLTDSDDEVCGLYIDRPYGAHQLLMDNVQDLVDWWSDYCREQEYGNQPIYLAPTWQREDGEGADFEYRFGGRSKAMYCPSAELGYQDTMSNGYGPYTFFKRLGVESGTWTKKAYLARPKQDNVYLCSLKDVDYNAQKAAFVVPNVADKAWRGFISNDQKITAYTLIKYLGMPDSKFEFDTNNQVLAKYNNKSIRAYKGYHSTQLNYDHRTFLDICDGKTEVYYTLEELGFAKAEDLPYKYSEYNKTLIVETNLKEGGFYRAVDADIPVDKYGSVIVNRDDFSYPVELPYVDKAGKVVIPTERYNKTYSPKALGAKTDLSVFPWAVAIDLPYTIKGDTLTVTQDVKGYYAKAVDFVNNRPFIWNPIIENTRLSHVELIVTKDMPEFGYLKAVNRGWQSAFDTVYWRQSYNLPGKASYSVNVVDVNWPEEGYMPPCNLEDKPVRGISYAPSNTSSWQDVFDVEDDVYGDRVLNRLPDPYFSEQEEDYDEFLFD